MKKDEAALLDRALTPTLIDRILRRPNLAAQRPRGQQLVEEYRVAVEKCFVLPDFNEEHPLYVLDADGIMLILFGQWLYDPNTVSVSDMTFDNWFGKTGFPTNFTIRFDLESGTVFSMEVDGGSITEAEALSFEIKFKKLSACQAVPIRRGESLELTLHRAGLC